jgi:hypothetical protein
MGQFFSYIPTTGYDIAKADYATYQEVTNIFFRIGMVKEALDNISSYYIYNIKEGEKPEILADIVYGTPEAHWIIMMANDIHDAAYDWPLNYDEFNNYLANKYRTAAGGNTLSDAQVIAWSQGTTANSNSIHHYEMITERTDTSSGTTTTFRYKVDYDKKSNTISTIVPYNYYVNLPDAGDYENYTVNGKTVREKIYRSMVTVFDNEFEQNEAKREIKVIKPEYATQIFNEFRNFTKSGTQRLRSLV